MSTQFIQFITEHPVAHAESAWRAWQAQQAAIDYLHTEIMRLQDALKHDQQRQFEASTNRLKLVHSA